MQENLQINRIMGSTCTAVFPVLKTRSTQNRYLFVQWINNVERQRPLPNSQLTFLTDFMRCIYARGLLDEREMGL